MAIPVVAMFLTVACQSGIGTGSEDDPNPGTSHPEIVVESLDMVMLQSFPVQIRLMIRGRIIDGCGEFVEPEVVQEDYLFTVTLQLNPESTETCDQDQQVFDRSMALPVHGLSRGNYEVEVGEMRKSFTLSQDNILESHSPPPPE